MIGNYFYNESTRNVVVGFGSVFNNIQLAKKDAAGNVAQTMKVPLAYGPKAKWLARLREDPALNKKVALTLPRIGFEISGLSYDPNRKLNKSIKVKKAANGTNAEQIKSGFMPVPYNVDFELFIMSKNSDDALQIIEQILPYFQPEYTVTLREVPELDIVRDVPVTLNSIAYEDSYDGYNIKIHMKNFKFTPEEISYEPKEKEGYALVHVNEIPIGRSYSKWFHIPDRFFN